MSGLDLARRIAGEIVERNTEPALRFTLEKGEPGIFESKVGGTPRSEERRGGKECVNLCRSRGGGGG